MARESAAAKAKRLAVEAVEEICRACWPDGWPHLSRTASCEHGEYERPDPAEHPSTPADPTPPAGGSGPETSPPSSATADASSDPAETPEA